MIEEVVVKSDKMGSAKLQGDPRPSPQRRGFCMRNGQVQRYWHAENVCRLRFTNKAMAASVGCTVAELNALPIDPVACDIVFDALSCSQSGITGAEECAARRASYEGPNGAFDPDAFEADLNRGRRNQCKRWAEPHRWRLSPVT